MSEGQTNNSLINKNMQRKSHLKDFLNPYLISTFQVKFVLTQEATLQRNRLDSVDSKQC